MQRNRQLLAEIGIQGAVSVAIPAAIELLAGGPGWFALVALGFALLAVATLVARKDRKAP